MGLKFGRLASKQHGDDATHQDRKDCTYREDRTHSIGALLAHAAVNYELVPGWTVHGLRSG